MNIFREVRKINNRNVLHKLILLFVFLVMFITSTYAWFGTARYVNTAKLEGIVSSWDVEYFVGESNEENTYVFKTRKFYPGMEDIAETVKIYNTGELYTNIKYELLSVRLFGEEVLEDLKTNNEITIEDGKFDLFTDKTKYPFNITYAYDTTKLRETYVDDESTPNGVATVNVDISWEYEGTDAKDLLDTSFGEKAYKYYKDYPEGEDALVIEFKITSEMTNVK